jgi:predicted small metal-binding protein
MAAVTDSAGPVGRRAGTITMAKQLRCGDLMQGCDFVADGNTEDEVMQKAAEHAKAVHGLTEVSEELATKVRAAIRER